MANDGDDDNDVSDHNDDGNELVDNEDEDEPAVDDIANDDLIELMENFVISSAQDSTLDLTDDNRNAAGFMSTDTVDIPIDVEPSQKSNTVS